MEKTTKFWSRVGDWFRPRNTDGHSDALDDMQGHDGSLVVPPPDDSGHFSAGRSSITRFGMRRGEVEAGRAERTYEKVAALADTMQRYLDLQDQRSSQFADTLTRLTESLSHIPAASQAHLELLQAVRDGLDSHAQRTKRLEESLGQLPRLADAQRETMTSIARQLDLSRQGDERLCVALDQFQRAVSLMGEASTASADALRQVHASSSEREERLASMLERQTHRFMVFSGVAVGMAVVAAIIGLAAAVWGR